MWLNIAALGCLALIAAFIKKPSATNKITVVFRYDDFSATSPLAIEENIIADFREAGASITFGVVPFIVEGQGRDPTPRNLLALDQSKIALLKQAIADGSVDLALHGYSHQTHSATNISEFCGLDYSRQLEIAADGKHYLEATFGATVNTFIPPWNSYDLVTLKAAETLGFTVLSASIRGPAAKASRLLFLPTTCGLKRLPDAIAQARRSGDPQPVVVVLFHPYDFKEIDARGTLASGDLALIIAGLKSQSDIQLLSITQASRTLNDLSPNRFLHNKKITALSKLFPMRFLLSRSRMYSSSYAALEEFQLRITIFYAAVVGILFALLLV